MIIRRDPRSGRIPYDAKAASVFRRSTKYFLLCVIIRRDPRSGRIASVQFVLTIYNSVDFVKDYDNIGIKSNLNRR